MKGKNGSEYERRESKYGKNKAEKTESRSSTRKPASRNPYI
jgi:hypothetical protein